MRDRALAPGWTLFAAILLAIAAQLQAGFWIFNSDGALDEASNDALNRQLFVSMLAYAWIVPTMLYWREIKSQIRFSSEILLVLATLLSIAWSISPPETLREAIKLLLFYLFALAVRGRLDREIIQRVILCSSAIIVGVSLAVAVAFPNYGVSIGSNAGSWQGIFIHKNQFGMFCALSLIVGLCTLSERKSAKLSLLVIGLSLAGVLLSNSGNALVTVIVAIWICACSIFIRRRRRGADRALLWILFFAATIFLLFAASVAVDLIFDHLQKDRTLTGRTAIWPQAIAGFRESPLLGHGLSAFWKENSYYVNAGEAYIIPHAHNGYLDILLDLGLFGSVIFIAFATSKFRSGLKMASAGRNPSSLPFAVLIFVLVANFATSSLISPNYYFFLLVILHPNRRFAES